MAFHAAAILSGLAYLTLCLLVAGWRLGQPFPRRKDRRTALAALLAWPAWLGLPFGALPAFMAVGFSGAAALACLAVSSVYAAGGRLWPALRFPLGLGVALAVCAWYARQRGVPGDLLSLDTYVAMPLAYVAAGAGEGFAGAAGLVLLALGTLPLGEAGPEALDGSLRHLAGLAVWICLFLPVGPAEGLGLEGWAGFALDGLCFWVKILILDYGLRLAALGARPGLSALQGGAAGAGAVLVIF